MTNAEFVEAIESNGGRITRRSGEYYEVEPDPASPNRYYLKPSDLTLRNLELLWDR